MKTLIPINSFVRLTEYKKVDIHTKINYKNNVNFLISKKRTHEKL
jgi:hypothetical protein